MQCISAYSLPYKHIETVLQLYLYIYYYAILSVRENLAVTKTAFRKAVIRRLLYRVQAFCETGRSIDLERNTDTGATMLYIRLFGFCLTGRFSGNRSSS